MLFPSSLHTALADGSVTVAFRRWRRPTVRPGGTLRYPGGVLAIDEVTRITPEAVDDADARAAGATGREDVLARLASGSGELYRIRFHHLGEDPRVALAQDADLDASTIAGIRAQLDRLDERSRRGPWTGEALNLVADWPRTPARELAGRCGADREVFKRDLRKLKELGLIHSETVGYRLSPRGRAFHAADRA